MYSSFFQAIVLLDGRGDAGGMDGRGARLQPRQHDKADAQVPDEGEAAALHDLQEEHLRRSAQAQDEAGARKVPPAAGEPGMEMGFNTEKCRFMDKRVREMSRFLVAPRREFAPAV